MRAFFLRFKRTILLTVIGLVSAIGIYFVGRRNRKGELNLQIAAHELQSTIDKQTTIMQDFEKLQKQKVEIISDIATEKLTKIAIEERNAKKSDQDIVDLLRKRGSIK